MAAPVAPLPYPVAREQGEAEDEPGVEVQGGELGRVAQVTINEADGHPIDSIVIRFNSVARQPRPSLCQKLTSGVIRNIPNFAIAASCLYIASNTAWGQETYAEASQFAGVAGTAFIRHAANLKGAAIAGATQFAALATPHLPKINTALSCSWAVKKAWNAGSKKMGALWLAAGALSAALPYALKVGGLRNGFKVASAEAGTVAKSIFNWAVNATQNIKLEL